MSTDTQPQLPSSGFGLLRLLAWATIGGLFARQISPDPDTVLTACVVGAIAGIVLLIPLRLMLWAANPAVRREYGYAGIRKAVGAGFVTIVPFALLALVAEFFLGWNAVTAFAVAGMMAGSGAAAMEVARLGGKTIPNLLIGVLHGFGLSIIWTLMMLMVQSNG